MKKYFKYIPHLFLVLLILVVFRPWFMPGLITGGDFWPNFNSMYSNRPIVLYAWDFGSAGGMGGFIGSLLWIYLNFGVPSTILGKILGINWSIIERVYYLFPFLILSIFSSFYIFRKIFVNYKYAILSSSIFTFNTYILMVLGGGQIAGIGIAYALFPLVLYSFIKIINFSDVEKIEISKILKYSLIASVILSLQLVFDLRIAYVSLIAIGVYWIIKIIENKNIKYVLQSFFFVFLIPGVLSTLLHSFWIIPTIINHKNPIEQLGSAYSSLNAVNFFSFAKFENTIGLLHPNWPENVFGKVYFMKPEFLLLPILAFSSLFFVKKENKYKTYILFFAILGLLGAFLAKGGNDPFGFVYLWLFSRFPGFIMFRDSTKWYLLISLSYSILIPYSVERIYKYLESIYKNIKIVPYVFLIALLGFFLFLIRPAILGQLNGTLQSSSIPSEYITLENYLNLQNGFSRTFWVPTIQRFGFNNNIHPEVPAQNFFNLYDNSQILKKMTSDSTKQLLQKSAVKYIIVPYDSQGEIFLKDRVYDEKLYLQTVKSLGSIPWLKRINGFGKIAVFEVQSSKDHFWTTSQSLRLSYEYISPVEYILSVKNAKVGDTVIFAENFDERWFARSPDDKSLEFIKALKSQSFDKIFNSFILRKSGDYILDIYYYPQIFVNIGSIVSILTLIIIFGCLLWYKKIKK